MSKNYKWTRSKRRVKCARGSHRTIKRGPVLLRICCPAGKWRPKKKRVTPSGQEVVGTCAVGTRAYEVGRPK